MGTALSTKITQSEAEALWAGLSTAFSDVEAALDKIIKAEAWIPMGFDTFSQAWGVVMVGVRLAAELRAPVVYAMFAEGLNEDEVRRSVGVGSGVAKASITVLKKQRDLGVPANRATTRVRSYERVADNAPVSILHVELDANLYADYQDRADAVGVDLKTLVTGFLRDWYSISASRVSKAS